MEGFTYGDCGYSASSENDLNKHVVSQHVFGVVFGFIEDNNWRKNLKIVASPGNKTQLVKEGIFQCEECYFSSTSKRKRSLKTQVNSIHEGVCRFSCNVCQMSKGPFIDLLK